MRRREGYDLPNTSVSLFALFPFCWLRPHSIISHHQSLLGAIKLPRKQSFQMSCPDRRRRSAPASDYRRHRAQSWILGAHCRRRICGSQDTPGSLAGHDHFQPKNAQHVRVRAAVHRSSQVSSSSDDWNQWRIHSCDHALGVFVDHFFQKGEYAPDQLKTKMKELIADSPIRPHIGKADTAPLCIPRKDPEYIVVTCPECLRSSSIANQTETSNLQETECLACGATIRYLVDSSVLKLLNETRLKLPS